MDATLRYLKAERKSVLDFVHSVVAALGRLHVQSELFSSIFNVRRAFYTQDEDTVFFLFLYLPNKIHCDRAFGHTPLYYILNPPPPCALGRTNARSVNAPAQQGHFR